MVLIALLATTLQPIGLLCNAKDNSARILRSATPADIHPDWAGDSVVGTGQTFRANAWREDSWGNIYLRGDIYSTRGGLLARNVFILQREWNCTRPKAQKK